MDPDWNNWQTYSNRRGVFWFEVFCHSVHESPPAGISAGNYTARAYYMAPTLTSGGRNNRLGLVQPVLSLPGLQPGVPYTSPLLPDPMALDVNDPEGANDNIFSYRLRAGNQGG